MSNKTLIEWNADVGTRFLTIHPDGSFDIDKDAPPLFVIGELAKAFIRQQDYIKRLEEESESRWILSQSAIGSCAEMSSRIKRLEEFASRFLDPDDLGWAIGKFDRDEAREALGKERVESKAKEDKP